MTELPGIDASILHQFLFENTPEESVTKRLSSLGFGDELISAYLKEYKRLKHVKRRTSGFYCLAAGAITGLISCILAITNPVPELHNWFLFGFTGLAILIVFYGLYCIFE